jgi:hypothetical protein
MEKALAGLARESLVMWIVDRLMAGSNGIAGRFWIQLAICLFVVLIVSLGASAQTQNIYIAQSVAGLANGADCADALPYVYFNSAANWTSSTPSSGTRIGPGTTVHLCGTFTGSAGGTMLQFQGSGSSGHPITLFGEPGANFSAPYWSGSQTSGGAINTNGFSYITISGGPTCGWSFSPIGVTACNMTIVNTQNGTGLAYAASSIGIVVPSGSHDVEIKNTDIHNIYLRVGGGNDDSANYTNQNCIFMGYSGVGTTNITIDHNICHDVGWGILSGLGTITIGPGNELYNADHMISNAAVTDYIFGNHIHDYALWNNGTSFHHDGIHCYAGTSAGAANVWYIYNNQFDSRTDAASMTGLVFLEGNGSSTSCFTSGATGVYIFNNIGIVMGGGEGFLMSGNSLSAPMSNMFAANNTLLGDIPTSTGTQGAIVYQDVSNATSYNNAVSGLSILQGQHAGVTWSANLDYNFYMNCTSGGPCFAAQGVSSNSFATWQAAGQDTHGGANLASNTYFRLNTACIFGSVGQDCHPDAGSPLIGTGKNLSTMCSGQPNPGLGALCFDIAGVARPSSGAWDVGAYQFSSSSTQAPAAPTGLSASVN